MESLKTTYRPKTLRSYRSRLNIYFRVCQFYGLQPFPAPEWQLVRFARYLANGVTSYDTVKGYMSTIKTVHEIGAYQYPVDIAMLKMEMRSIRFELAGPIKKATPITPQILCDIYSVIQLSDPLHVVAYLALVMGFCLFLRKSNLVPETRGTFNPKEQLTWGNLWWRNDIPMITIEWSKTRQYRNKPLDLPLIAAKQIRVCPIYWLLYVKIKFSPKDTDPMFSYPSAGEMVPLTYPVLSKLLKEWVSMANLDNDGSQNFTLHGLRRGGANHALTVGLASEDIMLMGDWASLAYLEYIDLTMDRRVMNMVQFMDHVDELIEDMQDLALDGDDD